MAINRDAFIGNYLEETRENIRLVEDGILKLKRDPENEEVLNSVHRALHTIKGSSRMLKFIRMEKTAHAVENVFKGLKEERYLIDSGLVKLVFLGSDLFRKGSKMIENEKSDEGMEIESFVDVCERAYANEVYGEELGRLQQQLGDGALAEGVPESEGEAAEAGSERESTAAAESRKNVSGAEAPRVSGKQGVGSESGEEAEYQSIRVKLSSVEHIIEVLNSVIIKQFQFKQIQEELGEAEKSYENTLARLRKLQGSLQEEGVSIYREGQEHLKKLQDIHKSFVEQMATLEQNSYTLQEEIMQLSMLPLDLILGGLPRMVEEAALVLDKEVSFSMTGTDVLMDKAILENLNDPVLHLVRNSVDHGIEMPDEREKMKKSREGRLRVDCSSEGGNIIIRISDDGRGIDNEKVMSQALEKGLTTEAELEEMSENDVFNFIFMPGFSTKQTITDLSGRGVGLDIVRHNIDRVKGKIRVKSTKGEGTEFVLALPLSLATVSGFFVKSGGEKFLMPSNFVHKIVRLHRDEKIMYYNKEAFKLENHIIPVYSLAALLERPPENRAEHIYILVVESVGERIGIVVDSILQHESLIYKPVPPNLQKQKIIQGIVFDETYSIINILFIPELINRFKRLKSIDIMEGAAKGEPTGTTVLVVDDSRNTREIIKSVLEHDDYRVVTAKDGIEGLQQLKNAHIDLVITDLEMARMDGITMVENIRKESAYQSLPIIIISSSGDVETQRRATKAGANVYIVKSEFDRNRLLAVTGQLLNTS